MQSVIFSIIIHVIYFGGSLIHGWIVTRNYVPDIKNAYENVIVLQNEVSFGYIISPVFLVISFIVVAMIGAVAIQLFKKVWIAKSGV